MKVNKSIIICSFFILSLSIIPSFALDGEKNATSKSQNESTFNLSNIVDNLLAKDDSEDEFFVDKEDRENIRAKTRKEFLSAAKKYNQGNIVTSYDDYAKLIDNVENNQSMLALIKVLYRSGFFSLAKDAQAKIADTNQYQDLALDLKRSYEPNAYLTKEDEIYYAKLYSSIYFDNCAKEALDELNNKKSQLKSDKTQLKELLKNDYYFYITACANYELKKYNDAINSINKAITINPNNLNYQMFKINTLIGMKKYKDALNLIAKLENSKTIINFSDTLEIKKQIALTSFDKNEKSKKYHMIEKAYLEGNFEKSKKDCLNILNFDKDNPYIISLYAKSELASGNIENANTYFVNSYKLDKNNIDTIIGLGDIRYIHGDFKNASKMYKKAYNLNKNDLESTLKLVNSLRQYGKKQKDLEKLEASLDKFPKSQYIGYYKSAISIAQNNSVLKEEFLKRTLEINPNYENAIGELVQIYLKRKNFYLAKGLIYTMSFTLEKNYYYYYLCGLYNEAKNQTQDAIKFYKMSLNLNPSFEIANVKLLKLIPDSEEI